jgi:hypothetical protein
MISSSVAPLARFISATTSAFLLTRSSLAPYCSAWGATSGDKRGTASRIRATAALRPVKKEIFMPIQLQEENGGKMLAVHVSGKLVSQTTRNLCPSSSGWSSRIENYACCST